MTSSVVEVRDAARSLAGEVRSLLERTDSPSDLAVAASTAERVARARADIAALLVGDERFTARQAGSLCEDLTELTELQGTLLELTVSLRLLAVARAHAALSRLRACRTVAELLPAAAEELAACGDFSRTAISRLRGNGWRPEAVWISSDLEPDSSRQTLDYLATHWMPLGPTTLETDLIRRRAAALITADDPRINHEWTQVTGTSTYVAAPVMPAGRVIGFLHADCLGSGRALTDHDRDNLWTFAEGFGLLFERTVTLERLAEQRSSVRRAFADAERQISELADEDLALVQSPSPRPIGARAAELFRRPPAGRDDLTVREREVLVLMATGARNGEIADRLIVSEDTVKSHVKSVMRKLGAANRAEAVSLHLQAVRVERR